MSQLFLRLRHSFMAFAVCLLLFSTGSLAAVSTPGLGFTAMPGAAGATNYSVSINTLLFLTSLSFLPAIVLLMSGFTRIVIVLSLLRHAIGTQSSPPNQVIIAMSLFLTFFVMSPTLDRVYQEAYLPLSENRVSFTQALEKAYDPMRVFMLKQTREPELAMFAKFANVQLKTPEEVPVRVLVPAFVSSELKTAFQVGFIVFIPFVIIDMVVASILMSMGMMMMSPATVSMPFKLMLFVLVDGWSLLMGSLIKSFG